MKEKKKDSKKLLSKFPKNKYRFALQVVLFLLLTCIIEYIYARLAVNRLGIVAIIIGTFNGIIFLSDLSDALKNFKKRIPKKIRVNCRIVYRVVKAKVIGFCSKFDSRGIIKKLHRFLYVPIICALIFAYFSPIGSFLTKHRNIVNDFLYVIEGSPSTTITSETGIISDPTFEKRLDPDTATFHLEDFYIVLIVNEEEFNHIMFADYNISIENPYIILNAVSDRVNLCRCQLKPDGTQKANMQQKNKIADISDRNNIFMRNTQVTLGECYRKLESSATIDKIIEDWKALPEDIWNYDINWMLSNAYQKYAMEYYNQGGSRDTVLYYYYLSIVYAHKALEYDITEKKISRTLLYIAGRYDDLAYYPDILNPSERLLATQIADAYEQLRDMSIQ